MGGKDARLPDRDGKNRCQMFGCFSAENGGESSMSSVPKFQSGEQVYSPGRRRRGEVVGQSLIDGEWYYRVDFGTGATVTLGPRELEPAFAPLARLAAGDYGYASDFDSMAQATALFFAYRYERLSCLSNSRLDPKPYQIFVAHRVLQDLHPRYLLADEVGLGKTIEAGLILKELRARGLAERVLIVVPASLCEQWQGEMAVKFNEEFHIYDGGTIRENLRRNEFANPWERDNNIITSLQFARRQHVRQADQSTNRRRDGKAQAKRWIDEVDWDLVIFDEAHHLRRKLRGSSLDAGQEITESYWLGQALAERAKSLLLLTATPLQLSRYETYSLVELLDSSLFPSYSEFEESMSRTETIVKVDQALRRDLVQLDLKAGQTLFSTLFMRFHEDFWEREKEHPFWRELADCCLENISADQQDAVQNKVERLTDLFHKCVKAVRSGVSEEVRLEMQRTYKEFLSFVFEYKEAFHLWAERQHKLSEVMIRNRKREVLKGEFVERRAHSIQVDLTSEERRIYSSVSDYIRSSYARVTGQTMALGFVLTTFRKLLVSSRYALAVALERRAGRIEKALQAGLPGTGSFSADDLEERAETLESIDQLDDLLALTGGLSPTEAQTEIDALRGLAARARAIPVDSKADKLLASVKSILDSDPTEKVLIFTQFRETQTYLKGLFNREGYRVALFHGEYGGSTYSKRVEFERFKKDPAVRIMVSTEVGGEGLNFQFCRVMFNYDLPWNPMRIEQRIGRLDRIGQEHDVHIYNFLLEGTLDARILIVLQDRIRLFEETIGNLDPILGEGIERDIKAIMLSDEAEEERRLSDFEEQADRRVREAREAETKMVDFIMDTRSFRRDTADEILGRKSPVSNRDIEAFTRAFLGRYPQDVLLKPGSGAICTITVPARFREDCRQLYEIHLEEKYTGTFDPKTAIEEDTIDFFAFGHPLFDAIIRYCTDDEGNNHFDAQTALRVLHHSDHAGYVGVQFNYVLTLDGVQPYKKLAPVALGLAGDYNEKLSHLVFSLPADEEAAADHNVALSPSTLRGLEEQSRDIIERIAERELRKAKKRNIRDYAEIQEKVIRFFDYGLRNQNAELEKREARLEDARQKRQNSILPAWEGQVRATQRRINELERQRDERLAGLQKQSEVDLSIDLLNVASVVMV